MKPSTRVKRVGYAMLFVAATLFVSTEGYSQQVLSFANVTEMPYSNASSSKFISTLIEVEGSVDVVSTPSAVRDKAGSTHIIFVDKTVGNQLALRYLRQEGSSWKLAEIDKLGNATQNDGRLGRGLTKQIPSIVMDSNGNLHFTYFKVESNGIKLYYGFIDIKTGTVTNVPVETITSNTSYQNGLAVDNQGIVHISFHNEGLKYANNKTGRFESKMLKDNEDKKPNFVERGVNSTLHIMPNGNILIPYQGTHHRNWAVVAEFIDCQVYANGVWKNVGIVGSMGTMNTNGFNVVYENGVVHLVYYGGGTLGYAKYENGRWTKQNFGMGETISSSLSAATAHNKMPVVAWYSRNSKLFISYRQAGGWKHSLVEGVEKSEYAFPSILPIANGKVEVFVRAKVQGKGTVVRIVEQ